MMLGELPPEILSAVFATIGPLDGRWATIMRLNKYISAVAASVHARLIPLPQEVARHSEAAVDYYAARYGIGWFNKYDLSVRHFRQAVPHIDLAEFGNIVINHPRLIPAAWTSGTLGGLFKEANGNVINIVPGNYMNSFLNSANKYRFLRTTEPGIIRAIMFQLVGWQEGELLIQLIFMSAAIDATRKNGREPIFGGEIFAAMFNYSMLTLHDESYKYLWALIKLNNRGTELIGLVRRACLRINSMDMKFQLMENLLGILGMLVIGANQSDYAEMADHAAQKINDIGAKIGQKALPDFYPGMLTVVETSLPWITPISKQFYRNPVDPISSDEIVILIEDAMPNMLP